MLKLHRIGLGTGLLCAAWLALLSGCPATSEDVRPPPDQFFFPTGLALSPDESVLFVSNSNSELRYDSGSVLVVDLDQVDGLLTPWLESGQVPGDCASDPLRSTVIQCSESAAIDPGSGVRIGNFSTDIDVQELASGDLRLFVAVRGDPSITWIEYSPADKELVCEGSGVMPLCDEPNRLLYLRDDPELATLLSEPFEVYVDSGNEYALVSHLSLGAVSLVNAPADGTDPMLVDVRAGLFDSDPNTGIRAAVGVAGRRPGSADDLVYVTSRSEDRVQMLYVHRPADPGLYPTLVPSEFFFLDGVSASDDSRGIAFGSDGARAYIANRDPPTLQIIDTESGADGFPRNQFVGAVEICRDPAHVAVADVGRGERVYVSCFAGGQVWVVDPRNLSVDAIIDVGRGPYALTVAPERRRLYVANFLGGEIAVIDITPGAATENRVVMRLGKNQQTGDE